MTWDASDASFADESTHTRLDWDAADASWSLLPGVWVSLPGPEGDLLAFAVSGNPVFVALAGPEGLVAAVAAGDAAAWVALDGPEGALAAVTQNPLRGVIALPGPEGLLAALTFFDWAAALDPLTTQTYYALDVVAGATVLRIPVSSWQATAQLDRASFLQAVIPAAQEWVGAVAALVNPQMVIYKGVRFEDGSRNESELIRSPITTSRYQEGPTNATLVLSGYVQRAPPSGSVTRALRNVRSISTDPGYRVRGDIDWFLQPGHTAIFRDASIVVAWINYYANAQDEFMDVGERAL